MPQIQRTFRHADIFGLISTQEPEKALALIDAKLKIEEDIEERSWLFVYQAWVYYSIYAYYPLAHSALNLVFKHRDELGSCILIEAYLIRALIHIQQKKYLYAYDSIEICQNIDPTNTSVKKLHELLLILLKQ